MLPLERLEMSEDRAKELETTEEVEVMTPVVRTRDVSRGQKHRRVTEQA